MSTVNLPSREATAYQWLRVNNLLSPTVEPIISAYADGDLKTREEFINSLDVDAAVASIPQWIRDTLGALLVPDALVHILFKAALGKDTK